MQTEEPEACTVRLSDAPLLVPGYSCVLELEKNPRSPGQPWLSKIKRTQFRQTKMKKKL